MVKKTNKLEPDVFADVYFLSTKEGGRKTPISTDILKCPLGIDGKYFESGLLLQKIGVINPGEYVKNVPIILLHRELLQDIIFPGSEFHLFSGKKIAQGKIVKVCWK